MKPKLIITHAAVFAVGISAALVASRATDSSGASGSGAETAAGRAAGSSAAGSAAGAAPTRARRDVAGARKEGGSGTPSERFAEIVRLTDPYDRQRALMNLIDQLGPDEFAGVADEFRELAYLGNSGDEYELLLRGWGKVDPMAALEYVEAHPNSRRGRHTILETWAGQDALAAERWALDNHDGEGPNPHLTAVIEGIAANDMEHATRLVSGMENSRERNQAVQSMSRALLLQGTETAISYADGITDPELRGSFVADISERLAGKDVDRAAEWIAGIDDPAIQNRAADEVAEALVRKDVKQAAEWVTTLKPEAQVEAAREIIPVMSREDIADTARWVASLAGTPDYDRAVESFIYSCDSRAPEQSATWIQGISDPNLQRRTYQRVLGNWARQDADAVRNWVSANNVPRDILNRFSR